MSLASVATLWPGFGEPGTPAPALTFAEALYAELVGIEDLAAIVGEEIYPQVLPQAAAPPAVSYRVISDERVRHLAGRTRSRRARIQLNAVSTDYPECQEIAKVLSDHFDPVEGSGPYAGPLGGSIEVQASLMGPDRDLYEAPKEGSDEGRHVKALDLILRYREPAP